MNHKLKDLPSEDGYRPLGLTTDEKQMYTKMLSVQKFKPHNPEKCNCNGMCIGCINHKKKIPIIA